jgi:hypothetical protein
VSYSNRQIEEENGACGCGCHSGAATLIELTCVSCKDWHIKTLRLKIGETEAEYKKLNNEFVHSHTASASLKQKIHDLLAWVRDSVGKLDHPAHDSIRPVTACAFCTTAREILDIIKTNKIGDNIIRMLRQRNEVLKVFNMMQEVEQLTCERCDDGKLLKDCSCEEIETAKLEAQDIFEQLVQKIRETKLDED